MTCAGGAGADAGAAPAVRLGEQVADVESLVVSSKR